MNFHNQWTTKQFKSQPKDWVAIRSGATTLQFYIVGFGISFKFRSLS